MRGQILGSLKTFDDYRRAEEEFQLKKELQKAQTAKAMQDATELDVKNLGERAFLKLGQGLPLSKQEESAARFLDAKSGGIQFDPATGASIKKPSLFDKIPLPGVNQSPAINVTPLNAPNDTPVIEESPGLAPEGMGEFEKAYREQLAAAAGNPKLQQTIKTNYAKSKAEPTVDESKAAGFADRMTVSDAIVGDPLREKAALDPYQRIKSAVPLIGNYITSGDYQSFNQAQRDFINAQLRRESGAVISPAEFDNAEKQYFPKPGDSKEVIAQKKANRESAVKAMIRSGGAFYEGKAPMTPKPSGAEKAVASAGINTTIPKKGERRGDYMFIGGNPNDKNNWKKVR